MADVQVDFAQKSADVTMQAGRSLSKEDCDNAFSGSKYRVSTFALAK